LNKLKIFIKHAGLVQLSWLNPFLLALFPALVIIGLQPIKFDRLIFEQIYVSLNERWFEDLDNDGKKERFDYTSNSLGKFAMYYYNGDGEMKNQINFPLNKPTPRYKIKPFSIDFTNDGCRELIIFTQKKDSLFLNVFNYAEEQNELENLFVTRIGFNNDSLDYSLNWLGHFDVNHDRIPEFYFSVSGGFALYPRKIFRFDFKQKEIISTINTGAGLLNGTLFIKDDSLAVLAAGRAYGNTRKDYPYPFHDTTTWILGFDHDLNLKFKPRNYGSNPGNLTSIVQAGEFIYYLNGANNASNEKHKLLKTNWHGQIVDSIVFSEKINSVLYPITIDGRPQLFFTNHTQDEYFFIDTEAFKLFKHKKFDIPQRRLFITQEDLLFDGKTDYFFYDGLSQELECYNTELKKPISIAKGIIIEYLTTTYYEKSGYGEILVCMRDNSTLVRYRANPYRHLKYPLWVGIYLLSALFVSLILFLQNRRILKQQKMEQELADLQLQNLRNQLDPHFTFNVLNSVGNAIYKQDKEAAYDLFQRFTRMIRSSLMSSDKVFSSLKDELQFTQDYLEFQQIRFKGRFNYCIEVEQDINTKNLIIPKMLIQGFAENAVKHAFHGVDFCGKINISISKLNETCIGSAKTNDKSKTIKTLKIIIEDNGIGIDHSRELAATSGTQKGLTILQEQVKQINRIYKTSIQLSIQKQNIFDTKHPGTRIEIIM